MTCILHPILLLPGQPHRRPSSHLLARGPAVQTALFQGAFPFLCHLSAALTPFPLSLLPHFSPSIYTFASRSPPLPRSRPENSCRIEICSVFSRERARVCAADRDKILQQKRGESWRVDGCYAAAAQRGENTGGQTCRWTREMAG